MSFIRANKLLYNAAREFELQNKKISSKEIKKRLGEIKYLSSQRKVPKLTLRREIIHLEKKLENLFEMEKRVSKVSRKESSKISSLKRQNSALKAQLASSKDPHLVKKVEKLSHVLGDLLAKAAVKDEVSINRKLLGNLQESDREKVEKALHSDKDYSKIEILLHQLHAIKNTIGKYKTEGRGSFEQLERLETMVRKLETKLLMKRKGPVMHEQLPSQRRVLPKPKRSAEDMKKIIEEKKKQVPLPKAPGPHVVPPVPAKPPKIIHEGKNLPSLHAPGEVVMPPPPVRKGDLVKERHNIMFKAIDGPKSPEGVKVKHQGVPKSFEKKIFVPPKPGAVPPSTKNAIAQKMKQGRSLPVPKPNLPPEASPIETPSTLLNNKKIVSQKNDLQSQIEKETADLEAQLESPNTGLQPLPVPKKKKGWFS